MAAVYIVLNLLLSWLATWAQKRFAGEKKVDITVVAAGLSRTGDDGAAV